MARISEAGSPEPFHRPREFACAQGCQVRSPRATPQLWSGVVLGQGLGRRGCMGEGREEEMGPPCLPPWKSWHSLPAPGPPAACPPGCIQGQGAAEEPGERADIQCRGWPRRAALAGAAFWVNIVLGFFFISLQTSPSQRRHITLNKASQCC